MSGYLHYHFENQDPPHTHSYILRPLLAFARPSGKNIRVLDVGCGNGAMAGEFLKRGCSVVGIDLSVSGIERARQTYPEGRFELRPADSDILDRLGCEPFDLVISTEVVEHLYDPRAYVAGCFDALKPGGRFICSTPYHGYLKNLLISLAGKWDSHANPLWDCGHIKLWSRKTLANLLSEAGFENFQFVGAGRLPFLWMSMVVAVDKPKNVQPGVGNSRLS